ncbi:MAG: hypothetical protein LBB89_13465 [Treponema sp.]|jgi:hypothetical protein|nr:hypothetical protein [Treponema sp.]
MKTKKIILALAVALAFALTACPTDDGGNKTPKPHTSTITAFDKTATVTGNGSIPKADFEAAVGKLKVPLTDMSAEPALPDSLRTGFAKMMERGITIVPGNTTPASVGGALTVGVDYLKSNTEITIGTALANLVNSNAFAD